ERPLSEQGLDELDHNISVAANLRSSIWTRMEKLKAECAEWEKRCTKAREAAFALKHRPAIGDPVSAEEIAAMRDQVAQLRRLREGASNALDQANQKQGQVAALSKAKGRWDSLDTLHGVVSQVVKTIEAK